MKKVYATMLVAALGAGSLCAQEPALSTVWTKAYDMEVGEFDFETPNWSSANAIKTMAGMRNAVGIEGKLYGIDMRTMSVTAFDENGATKAYSLPSLEGQTLTYVTLDDAGAPRTCPDYYGSLISRDDAGHLLIGHGYNTGAINYTWTVLDRSTGATKHLAAVPHVLDDLRACLPQEMVGRAIGDVTKEGYLYLAPTSIYWPYNGSDQLQLGCSWGGDYMKVQRTKILSFKGDGTLNGTNMTLGFSGPAPLANWFLSTAAPWYSSIEDMKAAMAADPTNVTLNQTFFFFSKAQGSAGGPYDANVGILSPTEEYTLNSPVEGFTNANDILGINFAMYQGFDTFELNGKRYYVAAFNSDEETKKMGVISFAIFDDQGWLLYNSDETEMVWSYDGEWTDEGYPVNLSTLPCGSFNLNVEKVDENNVNIYLWAQAPDCGVFAGMFNFGNGNTGLAGVEDVVIEAGDEAPVYYNLNGIRVAEPANGVFIKKCGNKVTKVIK